VVVPADVEKMQKTSCHIPCIPVDQGQRTGRRQQNYQAFR
jgi:hypothetical protein